MSSKENKKAAQARRAREREEAQKRLVRNRILIGTACAVVVIAFIVLVAKNPGGKEDADTTADTTASTEVADTATSDTTAAADAAAAATQPTLDTTEGREVKEGDTVAIDYVGTMDGEPFSGGTGSKDLTIGSGVFIKGFEDGLIGHTVGETVDLNLTFPENYHDPKVAGKDVVFTVTINGIYDL